jgi:glycosyltransferase involved in cell wall biosynthesis
VSSPAPLPLSVVIVAKNEAQNLPRCLASVRGWVAEIVVALNDTTDASAEIGRAHGAKVHNLPWRGFRDSKNDALALAAQPWVLALDADEAVSPELRAALNQFFVAGRQGQFVAAEFARRSWFLNRWIWHGDWYPDRCLRLVQRGAGQWGGDPAHTHIVVAGPVTRLDGDLLHFPFPDLRTFVTKSVRQSDDFVQIQRERGRRWQLGTSLFRPPWRFVRGYVLRRGFLDGYAGFFIAAATTFVTFLRYSRLYEAELQKSPDA